MNSSIPFRSVAALSWRPVFTLLASASVLSGCITLSDGPTSTVTGEYLAGRLAARTNDHATAAEQFSRVQAVAPGSIELRKEAFMFNLLNGNVETAAEYALGLARFAGPDQDALIPLTLAVDDIKHDRFAAARNELGKIRPDSVHQTGAFLLRTWALAGDRGPREALNHLTKPPAKIFTGFSPLHGGLLAEKAGRITDAEAGYRLAFVSLGSPIAQRTFSTFLERYGEEDTRREVSKILLSQPGPTRRLGQRNLARLEDGETSDALADATPEQGSAIALYMIGSAITEQIYKQREAASDAGFRLREPDLNQSIALMQLALYLDPDLNEAHRFLGALNNINGQYEAAIENFSRIGSQAILYEQARIEMAGAYSALEDNEKAIALLQKLIANDEQADEARLALSSIYTRTEQFDAAVTVLEPAINRIGDEPFTDAWRFYLSRGDALIQMDNWEAAEADLKRAVEIAPEEPTALNYLGYSWAERGVMLTEAFDLLEKALEKQPRSGAITDSVGWAHYQLKDYDKAVVNLEKAVSLDPQDPTLTDHLGDAYWQLGRKIEARYEWKRALELEPSEKLKVSLEEKLHSGLQESPDEDAPASEALPEAETEPDSDSESDTQSPSTE